MGEQLQQGPENIAFRTQLILPEQRQLYDYWLERTRGQQLPRRNDINPAHFPRLLPGICLIDVARDVSDSSVRLAGTRLRDVYEREITGLKISELDWGEKRDYWLNAFRHTIENRTPTQGVVRGPKMHKDHVVQYWLKLPLCTTGDAVSMLLCLNCFLPVTEDSAVTQRRVFA